MEYWGNGGSDGVLRTQEIMGVLCNDFALTFIFSSSMSGVQ